MNSRRPKKKPKKRRALRVKPARYRCLKCGHVWQQAPGMVACAVCGHVYVKWLNHNDEDWS